MSSSLTINMNASITGTHRSTIVTGGTAATVNLNQSYTDQLTDGTGVDQADQQYVVAGTVSSGTPVTIDLAGSVTNAIGETVTFAKVKGILIKNKTTTASAILTVGAGSNPFYTFLAATGDGVLVGPDGLFLWWNPSAAGAAVTAGTGDILTLTAASGTISYEVTIIGTTG